MFLATDADPAAIRARMMPRENIGGDDFVTVMLDTDDDGRRAYEFRSNPRGVQWDALFTEGQGSDTSFDAVWESEGQVTEWGYVVRMEIPFLSLRFEPTEVQRWQIVLSRRLARDSQEDTYWPRVSARVEGTLTQSATLTGLEGISPGRNLQAIPYTTFRAFRALDRRPSGDQVGCASMTSPELLVTRRGVPLGQSITYRWSRPTKANLEPSGDGTASRIWVTSMVAVSSTGYSKNTGGP